uniref:Uncharacterized protein n=1 Tax=Erpetoichthys calabaricus TaxID=27687 RepID=A0A8C4RMK2_ERPCA
MDGLMSVVKSPQSIFFLNQLANGNKRRIKHFHFTAWPDHGVPENADLLIRFRNLVREHIDQSQRNSPTVVHCSAGVGRTGTLIALDHVIHQIDRTNSVNVYKIICDLRMHRPLMVQTEVLALKDSFDHNCCSCLFYKLKI